MPCLTKEIVVMDEACLILKDAKFVVDQSIEFRCLRLTCKDVRSTIGVHWMAPTIMVEVLLVRYLEMFSAFGCILPVLNNDSFARLAEEEEGVASLELDGIVDSGNAPSGGSVCILRYCKPTLVNVFHAGTSFVFASSSSIWSMTCFVCPSC